MKLDTNPQLTVDKRKFLEKLRKITAESSLGNYYTVFTAGGKVGIGHAIKVGRPASLELLAAKGYLERLGSGCYKLSSKQEGARVSLPKVERLLRHLP